CADTNPCVAGTLRCGPSRAVQRCKADNSGWETQAHCFGSQSCTAGQCSPATCTTSISRCTSDGLVERCIPEIGQFSVPDSCPSNGVCLGTSCVPRVCVPNSRFCLNPMTAVECDALGTEARVVERCTGNSACAAGGCLSACQAADVNKSFAGCQFYSVDMDNFDRDDRLQNDIVVANQSSYTGTVKVEVRQGAGWVPLCEAQVAAGATRVFAFHRNPPCPSSTSITTYIDRHFEASGLVNGLAYRVTSDAPVVAYQYNSDDLNRAASSSGASVLLPKATLGRKYYVLTWPQPDPALASELMF